MADSSKFYAKSITLGLAVLVTVLTFVWCAVLAYVISETDPDSAGDLVPGRCVDFALGLAAFFLALVLLHGAFVESRTFLAVWTAGSGCVLAGYWLRFYLEWRGGRMWPDEVRESVRSLGAVSTLYAASLVPVVVYIRILVRENRSTEWLRPERYGNCPGQLLNSKGFRSIAKKFGDNCPDESDGRTDRPEHDLPSYQDACGIHGNF